MSAESMLAIDFSMNLSILLAVQAALGRLHLPSLARALCVMCLNTVLARLVGVPFWSSIPVQTLVCMLCGALVSRSTHPCRALTAALALFCTSSAAAGFASLQGRLRPGIYLFLAAFAHLLYRRRNPAVAWNITVSVRKNGVCESFRALIDTGNRLKEHSSALPVLIVEERAVPRLAQLMDELEAGEIRTLGFGVLGSGGEMQCFRPDEILFSADDRPSCHGPPCWVAVFDGVIPGSIQALAPPEFAEYARTGRSVSPAAKKVLRRISYAIFNRPSIHLRPRGADQARFGLLHRRQ